jgi:kynureninase
MTSQTVAFKNTLEFAQQMDQQDPIANIRDEFSIPKMESGKNEIYLCGNSLGLQPKLAAEYVKRELDQWANLGVKGHFTGDYPWMPYHEFLADGFADLVGAQKDEVVSMNTLTANLHFMMVSFYNPTKTRHKILLEDHAFPSDHYAIESQIRFHGLDPDESMLLIKPRDGEETIRNEDVLALIEKEGDSIALILLPGVQYYTGQVFDIQTITKLGQQKGCKVGFDLAHAAGNIEMSLHDWNVDFACWCTYKYLNSGPGSVAGCFVHANHHSAQKEGEKLPRFAGWWGHDKQSRFKMENHFKPIKSAEAWQLSNPPVLSLAAIRGSLDTIKKAGGIKSLRQKAILLTGFMRYCLETELSAKLDILTPSDSRYSGTQLSIAIRLKENDDPERGKIIFDAIEENGVTGDWRYPNVIRVAAVPQYNTFEDAFRFVQILASAIEKN